MFKLHMTGHLHTVKRALCSSQVEQLKLRFEDSVYYKTRFLGKAREASEKRLSTDTSISLCSPTCSNGWWLVLFCAEDKNVWREIVK